jgi:hypothetical protein
VGNILPVVYGLNGHEVDRVAFMVDKLTLGKFFILSLPEFLGFLLPIIPLMFHTHLSSRADTIVPFVAALPRDLISISFYI